MGSELQYLTQTTENVSLLTCNETFTTLSASRTSTVIFSPRWDRWKHRTLERCGWSINYSQDDSRERESRKEHSRFGKYGSIRIIDCKWGVIFTTPEEAKEEFKGNRVGIIGVNEIRDIGKSFFFFFLVIEYTDRWFILATSYPNTYQLDTWDEASLPTQVDVHRVIR